MSYKTELQGNNTDLQTILDKVNALPDAGGGTLETCTVSVTVDYASSIYFTGLSADGKPVMREASLVPYATSFPSIVKGTAFFIYIGYNSIVEDETVVGVEAGGGELFEWIRKYFVPADIGDTASINLLVD